MRARLTFKAKKVDLSYWNKQKSLPIKGRSLKEVRDRIEKSISNDVTKLFNTISVESELKDRLEARKNCSYFEHPKFPKYIYVW